MKEGWTYMKLGSASTFMSGYTPNKDEIQEKGQYPYFKVAEMNKLGNEIFMVNTSLFVNHPKKVFPKGSIVFPKNGGAIYTEKKRILKFDSVVDLNTEALSPNDQVNTFYLFYFLNHLRIAKFDKGGGLPSLDLRKMADALIPIPFLTEQERIVERLDAAFAQIDELKSNAERQLAEARALFQSALTQAMQPKPSWQEKKLKEITTKIGSGATPRGGKAVYIENGVSLVRSMNVHYGFFKYDNLAHISDEAATLLNGVELKRNDVLFNITGASIARCCVVPDDALPARVNQHVAIIRPKPDIVDPRFLSYVLISRTHQKELLSIGLSGATRQALTKKDLENHVVSLPSPDEQRVILDYIDNYSLKVRDLEEISRKTAAECDALKQALLRQIFE